MPQKTKEINSNKEYEAPFRLSDSVKKHYFLSETVTFLRRMKWTQKALSVAITDLPEK